MAIPCLVLSNSWKRSELSERHVFKGWFSCHWARQLKEREKLGKTKIHKSGHTGMRKRKVENMKPENLLVVIDTLYSITTIRTRTI